jgi:hypothetical protein
LERNQLDSFGEDDEGDEAQLMVALVQRRVVGDDAATAMLWRRCSLKLFQQLSSLSSAWSREKGGDGGTRMERG